MLVATTSGDLNIQDYSSSRSEEKASPGYFAVTLSKCNINAEYTVTHSVGLHKYTATSKEPLNIIFDVGSFLSWGDYKEEGELDQELVGSEIRIFLQLK